ncbi:MAG: hypothetical protein WCW26_00715 [Candidatus Buchananbacteria bacterium]
MAKTKFLLLLTIVGVSLVISGCGKKTQADLEKAIKENAKIEQKVIVPSDLTQCSGKFFEKDGQGNLKNCAEFESDKVCSYYKTIKGRVATTHILEYDNACLACRFYGETGSKKIDDSDHLNLGYSIGNCPQLKNKK